MGRAWKWLALGRGIGNGDRRPMAEAHLQSDLDVEQILRIAVADSVRAEDGSLRHRLMLAASELGLSEEQIQRAEEKWRQESISRQELADYMAQQRTWFWPHALAYVVVNAVLVHLNFSDGDGFPWSLFPVVGWGIGLFAHWQEVFNTKSELFRAEFQKWRRERAQGPL